MKKGFTLIELLVAVGILAMVMSFASVIFRTSIDSQRTASANAEIMRKLRAITDQLNADFKGLRKDGEIFVVWEANEADPNYDPDYDHDGYVRFDRIMFFADGDFQSYNPPIVRGNIARVCYMLANRLGNPLVRPHSQEPQKRILAKTQHILTADTELDAFFDPNSFTDDDWYAWNNWLEYDKTTLQEWKNINRGDKRNMLSVISDVTVGYSNVPDAVRGSIVDPADPNSIHMLMCEGVGEFEVQGWYDAQQRWVPEVDPNGNGILSDDSDFFLDPTDSTQLDPCSVPGVLYPYPPDGFVSISGVFYCDPDTLEGQWKFSELRSRLNEERFSEIPGLGRALKFTFTLYDSKGVIKDGRTFTHIVYLD